MNGPDFSFETRAGGTVAGIDEAGRGPLAGPVVAVALVLDVAHIPAGLNDSKKLSREKRETLFDYLSCHARFGIGAASVAEIDRINILQATLLAMARANQQLVSRLGHNPDIALIDGNRAPALTCPAETLIGGDGRSFSIAAASVIAKVTRDRAMRALSHVYPGYGWERNAGYGSAEHKLAITLYGPTPHHRMSFKPLRTQDFVSE